MSTNDPLDALLAHFRKTVGVFPGESGDLREGRSNRETISTKLFRVLVYVIILAGIAYNQQFFIALFPYGVALFVMLLGCATSFTAQLAEAFHRNVQTSVGIAVLLAFTLFASSVAGVLSGGLILWMLMLLTVIISLLLAGPQKGARETTRSKSE